MAKNQSQERGGSHTDDTGTNAPGSGSSELSGDVEALRSDLETVQAENAELRKQVDVLRADLADAQQQAIAARTSGTVTSTAGDGAELKYVQRTVLRSFGYRRKDINGKVIERRLAKRGETVELTQEQADKLGPRGVVGSVEDLTALENQQAGTAQSVATDTLDESAVIAHLSQYQDDEELDRIELLEESRADGPREGVLEAIETIRAAKDA